MIPQLNQHQFPTGIPCGNDSSRLQLTRRIPTYSSSSRFSTWCILALTTSIQRALINCHCPIELNCNNCTNTDLELEYLRRQNRVTGLKDTELGLTLRQILFYLPPCRLSLSTTHRPTATATSPIQSLPPSPPTFLPPPAPPPHESHVSAERSPTTANNHGSSPSHPPPLAGTIHCIATAQPNEREGLLESDTDVERVSTHWNFGRGRKRASRSSGSISLGSEGWRYR